MCTTFCIVTDSPFLLQWGKEVISTKDKTTVTEEFKQLEKDVELRKAGIERYVYGSFCFSVRVMIGLLHRIQEACSEYYGYLHKKKEYPEVEEGVKMLSIDALGVVMVAHGEEFGSDSAFGKSSPATYYMTISLLSSKI